MAVKKPFKATNPPPPPSKKTAPVRAVAKPAAKPAAKAPLAHRLALVLATQAMEQKTGVRVLLCSDGGQLALKGKEGVVLKPRNVTPNQMLQGLMKNGAKVEVCALFLPNSGLQPTDLIEGVGVAKPGDVAAYLLQGNVKTLTY